MGGINCGQSNNRTPHNGKGYALYYAFVMKDIFKLSKIFSNININVEKMVINEGSDSRKALNYLDKVKKDFDNFAICLNDTILSIKNAKKSLKPFFMQKELRDGFVEPYKENNKSKESHEFWIENGELPKEDYTFELVFSVLKEKGDLGYLELLEDSVEKLRYTCGLLSKEYGSSLAKANVKKGKLQLAIRDADNNITALTVSAVTSLHNLFVMASSYCLLEYTSHTSLTGKDLNYREYSVPRIGENDQDQEA